MNELEKFSQAAQDFINDRDWKQFHKPKDCAISLTLEAAEVAEVFQWKTEEEMEAMKEPGEKNEALADELADVMFWVLELAHDFNINLSEAFEKKLKKSADKYPIEKAKGQAKKYTEL